MCTFYARRKHFVPLVSDLDCKLPICMCCQLFLLGFNLDFFSNVAVDYILMDPSERQRLHIKEIPKAFPQRYYSLVTVYSSCFFSHKTVYKIMCAEGWEGGGGWGRGKGRGTIDKRDRKSMEGGHDFQGG